VSNKTKYRDLCQTNANIPIFSQDWWLDVTAGDNNWDVCIVEKSQQIVGSLPYYKKKKFVFDFLGMPKMTKCLGVWIKYPSKQKHASKLSYEKEVFLELIRSLPRFDYFYQHFHWSVTNWIPFYWEGFKQTTRYTYVLENIEDLDQVFSNFKENIRREIRKAEKILTVV
jgi:hypothetical protein